MWALVDGPEGAEVPIVAGVSERQAFTAFNTARRMVQLDPELSARVQVFQSKLYMPHHDATLYPLPADADALWDRGRPSPGRDCSTKAEA
jgi:hypothetical protein